MIMSVSYTISWQDKVEDGERNDTLYQCPLCGIAYNINRNHGWYIDCYQVTDDCTCHDEHRGESEGEQHATM